MKLIKKKLFLILVVLPVVSSLSLSAKEVVYDSSGITERKFNKQLLEDFKNQKEFIYQENNKIEGNGFIDALLKLLSKIFRVTSNENTGIFWEVVFYMVIAAFVIFLIFRIVKADKSWFLYSKKRGPVNSISIPEAENIHEINFNDLIKEAIVSKNYRTAIRFLYLQGLKSLSDKELILWRPEKTNYEYQKEIHSEEIRKLFQKNTLIYEYIWYGDFKIEEVVFGEALLSFQSFNQKITNGK